MNERTDRPTLVAVPRTTPTRLPETSLSTRIRRCATELGELQLNRALRLTGTPGLADDAEQDVQRRLIEIADALDVEAGVRRWETDRAVEDAAELAVWQAEQRQLREVAFKDACDARHAATDNGAGAL